MRDLVIVCDPQGRVILINRAMEAFSGLEPVGVLPELSADYGLVLQPDGTPVPADETPLHRALRGERVQRIEMLLVAKSGRRCRMVADGERVFDADGALLGALVVWRDITDQRDAEEKLAFFTLHDSLTGLPNRALFIDRVRSALARAPRYSRSISITLRTLQSDWERVRPTSSCSRWRNDSR
jgi:PAS domain S-box-containing protein